MANIPYVDEDLYMIIPSAASFAAGNIAGKVSQPIVSSTTSPPSQEQYIYFAIKDYHPDKEGYITLTAGEAVEVLDKSNSKQWFITTVETEERPSEEGLVPANILSAEYIPVHYDSIQDEYSGSDDDEKEQLSRQQTEPPPLPPHHPSHHDDDKMQSQTGSHMATREETVANNNSPQTKNNSESTTNKKENVRNSPQPVGNSPQPGTKPSAVTSVTLEEKQDEDEDTSSGQSDTTPIVSPRGSLHSGSNRSSPLPEKRDPLFSSHGNSASQLTHSMTVVEINSLKRKGMVRGLPRYGSDPSLQDPAPLSDSSPAFSIPNLTATEAVKSPMHERVSSILRESLMSSSRNRCRSTNEYTGHSIATSLDHKKMHASTPMLTELRSILNRSSQENRSSSISPEDARNEVKKLQAESVEVCSFVCL